MADGSIKADKSRQGVGVFDMRESHAGSLLLDYYESFLRDRDLDQFRQRVTARYTEGTLTRILASAPGAATRRAAVLALGISGTFEQSNVPMGKALQDPDSVVRSMAESALWAIWFRADTPENNQRLEEVRFLLGRQRTDEAIARANLLIIRTPRFAEAFNQRAIAYFMQGRFAESAADCQKVLQLNPFHIGAVSGLAKCQLELDQPHEALKTLKRALKLQPYNESLSTNVRILQAQIEADGTR